MVKTLPFADIQVPSPGFGAMGLSFGLGTNLTPEQAEPVLLKAIELGCTFWDTAVVYAAGINEKLLGDFIRKHNVRDKIFIASKCGLDCFSEPGQMKCTNSASHIQEFIEGTIERLGFTPDLYYLHRIDPNTPLEESIPALDGLRKAGKTKYIGLSECSAATLRKANSSRSPSPISISRLSLIVTSFSRPHRRPPSRILRLRNPPRARRPHRHRQRTQHRLRSLLSSRTRLARRRLPIQVPG